MENNDSLVISFAMGCLTVLLSVAMFVTPGCDAVKQCLSDKSPSAATELLCERIVQQQYPLKTEYPNDEATAR